MSNSWITSQRRSSAQEYRGSQIESAPTKRVNCKCGECQRCKMDRYEVIDGRYAHLRTYSYREWSEAKKRAVKRPALIDRLAKGESVKRA